MVNAVAELERMWAVRKVHPFMPKGITTINTGAIAAESGGNHNGRPNVMTWSLPPDYCAIDLSLKYLPSERAEDVRSEFETFIHHICQTDDWLRDHPPTIQWGLHGVSFPPANASRDHPAIQAFATSIRSVGIEPDIRGFEAIRDIAWFGEETFLRRFAVLVGAGTRMGLTSTSRSKALCRGEGDRAFHDDVVWSVRCPRSGRLTTHCDENAPGGISLD